MGSKLEFNDTLVLTRQQGFPTEDLRLELHLQNPILAESLKNKTFHFTKDEARIFHIDPTRVFLVENIEGKWLHWGHVLIQSQKVEKVLDGDGNWQNEWTTSGTYKIAKIYHPDYQRLVTNSESPAGKSFF